MSPSDLPDSEQAIAADIAAIDRISAVPALLRVICDYTGLGFAAVARVTEGTWTACAVQDNIGFGLKVGHQLELSTTLCNEARLARQPVMFDHASEDPVYKHHHTPRLYGLESYISVPILRKDGRYFGNLCAIDPKPAHVSDARTLGMFTLLAELISLQLDSEDRQAAMETALQDERATAKLREQFIAVLGHDIRNPLAAIGAAAELLVRQPHKVDVVRMGERLRSIARRMNGLINDVMDFARGQLGSGIGVAPTSGTDLAPALADVITELREVYPGRKIADTIHIEGSVCCDKGRVQQLLSNLLGNALSHGAVDEEVIVTASVQGEHLVLSVSNRGTPIAPVDLVRIFEPYWRPASSKPGGGLGLGLYICEQITKAHGGSIAVASSAQDGTCFTVKLPVRDGLPV